MKTHTPGPWMVVGPDCTAIAPEWAPSERVAKAMAVSLRENDDGSFPEIGQWQRADARLIAAAPELLAACKELFMQMRREGCGHQQMLDRALAAIAKAEGAAE